MSNMTVKLATFLTSLLGITAMDDSQFNPKVFFFYLIGIIFTAVVIGIMTELGIEKLKARKNKNDMGLGIGHF